MEDEKLYYEDCFASAYMVTEFKVRLMDENWQELRLFHLGFYYPAKIPDVIGFGEMEYYIHPDSYHIFEPKDGDLCVYPDDNKHYFLHKEGTPWANNIQIIQRNNKQFFMPKVDK